MQKVKVFAENVRRWLDVPYHLLVAGNQKAIQAFVLSTAATHLASVGLTLETTIGEVLTSLVVGAITGAGVWFKKNQ